MRFPVSAAIDGFCSPQAAPDQRRDLLCGRLCRLLPSSLHVIAARGQQMCQQTRLEVTVEVFLVS